jgi:hypothetical protein
MPWTTGYRGTNAGADHTGFVFAQTVFICSVSEVLSHSPRKTILNSARIDDIGYYDIVLLIMKVYLAVCAHSLALVQLALAGEAGRAVVEQRTQWFTIGLNGSVADVTPLFGPIREAEWAPDWSPRFIHPAQGVQREGVVFTTTSGLGEDRLWLLTTYEVGSGRVEYVVITPALTASEIKIRVVPDGEQHCKATITYRRSALAPEGNQEVAKLDAHWAEQQQIYWEKAINEALAKARHP